MISFASRLGSCGNESAVKTSGHSEFRKQLLVFLLGGLTLAAFSLAALQHVRAERLANSVTRLTSAVARLQQEHSMPVAVLGRHRGSICYIHAVYSLTRRSPLQEAPDVFRTRVSATGFVAAPGIIATNRHVVEPWWGDDHDEQLIRLGAVPRLERLEAFFPGASEPVLLRDATVSPTTDVAVVRFTNPPGHSELTPLPLSESPAVPGDSVVVVGYPMGVAAMLAKSPGRVYKRLAYSEDTIAIARDLAAHYLIRPSATYGYLGDVVDEKLVYDAPTAQGGSGGPVFNSQGRVIGVNAAYIDGFAGGTIGISVEALKPLIETARR
jgi:S1-C subfamily serine protease